MRPNRQLPIAVLFMVLTLLALSPLLAAEFKSPKEANKKGKACYDKGDYDGAVAAYTEAVRLDPKNAEAYTDRGWAYLAFGQARSQQSDC